MTEKELDRIAKEASIEIQRFSGYTGRPLWEKASEEYKFGWKMMVKAVLHAQSKEKA